MIKFTKELFGHFSNSNTFQEGASLAYYAVFSILPMIILITSVLGLLFGEQAVSGEIYVQLKETFGSEGAQQIQNLIKNQYVNHNSILTSILGLATLTLSASGLFSQVHTSFNNIWGIKAKPKSSILKYITTRLSSIALLIIVFFIILLSTTANSFFVKHAQMMHTNYRLLFIYEHGVSILVFALIFAILFRFMGDAKVHWKAALLGGTFTALLFVFGKAGIAMYIGHNHVSTTFGSASVLALLMLWVYYTSQIIFLGASFIYVISKKLGHELVPDENAVKIEHIEVEH